MQTTDAISLSQFLCNSDQSNKTDIFKGCQKAAFLVYHDLCKRFENIVDYSLAVVLLEGNSRVLASTITPDLYRIPPSFQFPSQKNEQALKGFLLCLLVLKLSDTIIENDASIDNKLESKSRETLELNKIYIEECLHVYKKMIRKEKELRTLFYGANNLRVFEESHFNVNIIAKNTLNINVTLKSDISSSAENGNHTSEYSSKNNASDEQEEKIHQLPKNSTKNRNIEKFLLGRRPNKKNLEPKEVEKTVKIRSGRNRKSKAASDLAQVSSVMNESVRISKEDIQIVSVGSLIQNELSLNNERISLGEAAKILPDEAAQEKFTISDVTNHLTIPNPVENLDKNSNVKEHKGSIPNKSVAKTDRRNKNEVDLIAVKSNSKTKVEAQKSNKSKNSDKNAKTTANKKATVGISEFIFSEFINRQIKNTNKLFSYLTSQSDLVALLSLLD